MSKFSLNADMNVEVTARFITKGSDTALTGDAYKLRLFDKDVFDDDYIGESYLDSNGVGKIQFTIAAFGDIANLETTPDFYFVLVKNGVQIFESKVMEDVDIAALEQFKMGEGGVLDLGTFLVEV